MPKKQALTRLAGRDFFNGFSKEKKLIGQMMVVQISLNECQVSRFAVICSSRYGNAVVRNRFKRLVREVIRHSLTVTFQNQSIDIRVFPRQKAKGATFLEIKQELLHLLFDTFNGKSNISFD